MHTHTRNFLILMTLTGILFLAKSHLQTTEFSMIGVSLSHLAHQADLIIEGKVLGKVESDTTEFLNNSVGVEKVIKGNYTGSTINILTEQMSESLELAKGEHLILFLSKENRFDDYVIIGYYQGKMQIDPKGVVYGLETKNMSVPEMEHNIADLLSKPVNDTIIHNATEVAMYANDSDLPFSDTILNGSDFNN